MSRQRVEDIRHQPNPGPHLSEYLEHAMEQWDIQLNRIHDKSINGTSPFQLSSILMKSPYGRKTILLVKIRMSKIMCITRFEFYVVLKFLSHRNFWLARSFLLSQRGLIYRKKKLFKGKLLMFFFSLLLIILWLHRVAQEMTSSTSSIRLPPPSQAAYRWTLARVGPRLYTSSATKKTSVSSFSSLLIVFCSMSKPSSRSTPRRKVKSEEMSRKSKTSKRW